MSPAVLALVLVATGWLIVAAVRTVRLKRSFRNLGIDDVGYWLECLYESRRHGAYVIFEDMDGTARFVQFRREAGKAGTSLSCDFPIAEWSESYVQPLKRVLDEKAIGYIERTLAPKHKVSDFVVVENLDSATATTLTDVIFREVFGHRELAVRVWGNRLERRRRDHQGV